MFGMLGIFTACAIVGAVAAVASLVTTTIVAKKNSDMQNKSIRQQENQARDQAKKQMFRDAQNFAKTIDANAYTLASNDIKTAEVDRNQKIANQRNQEHKQAEANRGSYQTGKPAKA